MEFFELAARIVVVWLAVSVLAAVIWSRFQTRLPQRERLIEGPQPPYADGRPARSAAVAAASNLQPTPSVTTTTA
jgi:hypothetical protein